MKHSLILLLAAILYFGGITSTQAASPTMDLSYRRYYYRHHYVVRVYHRHYYHRHYYHRHYYWRHHRRYYW